MQSKPNNTGKNLIVADELQINTDEMVTCKSYYHQTALSDIPPDQLKKMKEELLHVKVCINESQSNFNNKAKEINELVGIRNQVVSNVTHLSVPAYQTTTNSIINSNISTNNNNMMNQKITLNPSSSFNSINQKSKPEPLASSFNTRAALPKNSDQTQKTSSRNERLINPSPKVRNERSARAVDRNIGSTSSNSLDIWIRSAPIFKPLPSVEEMDDICRPIDASSFVDGNQIKQHWSDRLREIAKNSQKETKKSKSNAILMPPGRPPAPDDTAEYWVHNTPPFQIEEMQKHNKSVMHCLLSAFVEAKPLPESDELDEASDGDFMPTHALLPSLDFDEYMRIPFEERLELELKSAGLGKPDEETGNVKNAFAKEIEGYKHDIFQLQPKIDLLHDEIVKKLPQFRLDEDRRMTEAKEYTDLLKEWRKEHKKQ